MSEQSLPISAVGAKRRSTRIDQSIPLLVTWTDAHAHKVVEETTTVSVNCHGCRYLAKRRPKTNTAISLQISRKTPKDLVEPPIYPARLAWVRKSRRLEGLYQVGAELAAPLNIWGVVEIPEDWAGFSPSSKEDPAAFLADVDRTLNRATSETYYQLLGVEPPASRSELRRQFCQMASRFHPDHHMDHPEWTQKLLALMQAVTTAYKTLSDEEARKEYDSLLSRDPIADTFQPISVARDFVEKARECLAEKNYAGAILWLHRAVENEPNSSAYRAMLGRCLSAIPEYRREAVEQFEMALKLDPDNLTAHLYYGELLEQLRLPWRAQSHYLRVLDIDIHHREAHERINRIHAAAPRPASRSSIFDRLTRRG